MKARGFTFDCECQLYDEIKRRVCEHYKLDVKKPVCPTPYMVSGEGRYNFKAEHKEISCYIRIHRNSIKNLFTFEISDFEIIELLHA